ncbi:MAG: InlB B-repeat-containing protein, partial [Paludibacteraceae bacterium]|nr:InlB B-repeat-containing protein [Paludibacteraceae bacterium]
KDVCGNTLTPELTSEPSAISCEGDMVYVYTYTDCAGNSADYTFTYTVQAPVLTFSGTISDVENINDCYSATLVSYLLTDEQVKSMYSSNCDKTITVSHLDDTESDNNCGWKIIRTFTISDGCNEETKTQSVSGSDQTEPTISGTLAEKTVEGCSADLTTLYPAATTVAELEALGLSVSDNCTDDADMIVEYDEENEGTCPIVVTRTYTIKDACGNPTTVSQTIKVDDTTKPSISDELITSSPADVANCIFTVPDFESVVRSEASDNCTAKENLIITQDPLAGKEITETTVVTVSVEDACGNPTTTTITVTVPEKLKGKITSAESFCYNTSDGVIEGTIEGGSAPYTVSWAGAAIGSQPDVMDIKIDSLPDGDYIVTVTDVNGCHDELNASIAQLTQTITLKADSKEKVYDGKKLTLQKHTGVDNLEPGDVIDDVVFSDDSKITNVGEVANTITSFRIMRGDKDVTCYYDTMMVPGLLKVTKRQVTLTSLDSTKFYDGNKLIRHEVVVSGDGFAAGEGATYDVTGSQTLVGSSENEFTYTLNDGTLADNYDITVVKGTLEVKANVTNIAIASASKSWTYDCDSHKHEVYTVTYGTEEVAADESGKIFTLPTGDKLTITPTTEGVKYVSDTEERNNTFTYTLENDDQYAGDRDTTYGTLSITRRPIVITAKDSTKIYDAIALTRNEFFTDENEADCDNVVSVVIEGSQLNVGRSVNKISDAVIKSGDEVVTDNYDITYVDGTLEVTPLDVIVTITGHTKTVIYNGTEQTVYGYEWIASDSLYNTADYFTYAGDSVAKGTTVDTYPMGLEAGQFNNTNNNFNVTFDVTDGWLTINRLDVIVDITGHVDTRTYNGKAQYVYGYDWKANTDLYTESDFRHVNDSVAAGTTIGTYPMGLEVGQFTNVNENFTVSFNLVSDGWLTINKIPTPITITAFSSTMVYDGGVLTDDEFRYTRNVLVDGDVLFADVEGSIMDVGSVPNVVTGYRVLRDGEDVTENYTFNPSVDGTLTITKRPVTFTSATDEKTYDGTPLTNSTVAVTPTATGKGFVQGEGAKFIVTGTITEIGTVDNTFTFEPYSNTDTANYDITVVFGKLTINKIVTPIVITANSNSKMYDGTPLTDDGFTFTTDVVAEGDALIADVEGTITDFGTVANKVTGYRVVRGADDVTKNYTFGESVDGTLSITKRHVTLTSASDSKVYDRRPLTNSEVIVGGDGFAENEGATYNVKGTIIDFGKVANAFDYALKTNTKAINYDIDTVYGTLSITKRPTAIVYNYGYDVKPDTVSGFADEPYAKMSDPVRTGYDFKGWDAQLPALLPLDTLTVTAQWSLVTYEIQLDTFETITYTVEDHKVIDLNDYIPYYEGHDFMGWRNNNGEIVTSISTDDAGSVQLTATWHIATYYITYISNGKTLKTVPIVFADPIPAIEDPVREGYLFKGWSPAIPATMPEGGVTVTAQWGLITYQLTLEDEGKVVGVYEYTVEDEFFYIDKIEDREGMRFDGWMLNGAMLDYDRNEGKYVFFPSLFADNVSISAKWTMISDEFNLVYKVDGVTYLTYVISAGESTASYVASVQDPADKRGYKFNGWDMDVPETMPRKSLTVNAVWKPITYAITLRDTSGEEIERIYYTIEETVQLPTYPDRDGQIFLGWSDGVNTYYEIKPGSSAEDFELTASWGVKSFEIIYIVDGIEYARDTIQAGAPLVKISDPETAEEGYAFSGWSTTPDIMPAHDLTVTGSFEKGGYTLTYVIDGETIKSVRYLYGAAISPTKAPNRPGYAFDVWEGLPATMPARDLTVNGKYKVATYSIVLRNEGVALDTIYYTIFDDAIALPVIEGPGKMFKGWYDGRKTVNRIKPSDYSGNIDLVASWIYFNYTVTFYVDDVQYSKNNSMRYGDVIQLPEEPTKEGLYFAGWKNMPADGLMPENDLKLYAIFSTEPVINVGTDDFEEVPTVDVYTEVGEIVVLRAENMDIQVLDFDGVTLFIGKSNAEKFSIPVRYRGAYIVRINNQFRKVLVK